MNKKENKKENRWIDKKKKKKTVIKGRDRKRVW